jgi:hypothetical protein
MPSPDPVLTAMLKTEEAREVWEKVLAMRGIQAMPPGDIDWSDDGRCFISKFLEEEVAAPNHGELWTLALEKAKAEGRGGIRIASYLADPLPWTSVAVLDGAGWLTREYMLAELPALLSFLVDCLWNVDEGRWMHRNAAKEVWE